jgi:hypothetical protein
MWASPDSARDLLDASSGTVDHVMALTISAPDPILAISKIAPFNATESNRFCVQIKELAPTLPVQSELLPRPEKDKEKRSERVRWDEVAKVWQESSGEGSKGSKVAQSLVGDVADVLGWNKPAPEVLAKSEGVSPKPWELRAVFPARLVTGTTSNDEIKDGLDNYYLALPRIMA